MVGTQTTLCGQGIPLIHRSIRMRARNPKRTEDHSVKSPRYVSSITSHYFSAHSSSASFQSFVAGSNEDLGQCAPRRPNCSRSVSNASTELSDYSNYLPSFPGSSEDLSSIATSLEAKDCCMASPAPDFYGWDAELDRRAKFSTCAMEEKCQHGYDTVSFTYRRANGGKGSLLQRVFNVGSSTSLGKY